MASLFTPFAQFLDDNGNPLDKGTLEFLKEGTTDTRLDTFSDSALTNKNTNPVVLDGEGRLPNLIFGKGVYSVVLKSKKGVLIDQLDPVGGSSGAKTAFDVWDEKVIYNDLELVTGSDENRYEAQEDGILNKDPVLAANSALWERIGFVQNQITNFTVQHFYRNR